MGVLLSFVKGPLASDRTRLADMSSTVTTPGRKGARVEIPPETAAYLDSIETEWLTPQEFAADRRLGWFDRTVLQKAAGANACGLKDARRERGRKVIGGREQIIYEYPIWRIMQYLRHGLDGSPPGRTRRPKRQIRFLGDPTVDELAARTGMNALQVLHHISAGELDAVLHPTEDRILFLDATTAERWINRQAHRNLKV